MNMARCRSSHGFINLRMKWIRRACTLALAMGTTFATYESVAEDFNTPAKAQKAILRDHGSTDSSSNLLHFDLRPTASLVGERRRKRRRDRHRRLTAKEAIASRESNSTNSSYNVTEEVEEMYFPKEWFHPNMRAVYATLHPHDESDENDGYTAVERHHFRDFVKYRHLSRFERHFRESMGLNLHPHWSGNYADSKEHFLELHDPSVLLKEILDVKGTVLSATNISNSNDTVDSTIPHPTQRKLLKSLVGGKFDRYQGVPLSQGYGTHYVHLWVGSPVPQRQSVIVDTGSHFTGFPVAGECKNCGESQHTDPHFDPMRSESFRTLKCPAECLETFECEVPKKGVAFARENMANATAFLHNNRSPRCSFSQAYTEGSSWTAYQASDLLYCGGGADMMEAVDPLDIQYSLRFVFGCLKTSSGLFVTQLADGIMGMSAHELTLPKQLYNKDKIEYNMFAMCFRKELGTSKKGVTAGSMTLGGVSSALDTSPMVYARNIRHYGWYTVYVEKIYLATMGGTKFLFDDASKSFSSILEENNILPLLGFHPAKVNRERGVIVDSGTTDTYLCSSIRKEFFKAWKEATGMEYSNSAIYLTTSQLEKLPTLLLQLQASGTIAGTSPFSNNTHTDFGNSKPVLGQVGYLDPDNRYDVLLSIPATSYMEYSPTLKVYTSRLFFTESRGGVIGANAMQGHNVLFDWQHGRIGFAQSSCSYDLIAGKNDNHGDFGGSGRGGSSSAGAEDTTCVFLDDGNLPILSQTCLQSVANNPDSIAICKASNSPTNVEVEGTEIWTLRIENSGNDPSSCEAAIREWSDSIDTQNQIESSTTECTPDGLCHEYRPCHIPCMAAIEYNQKRSNGELSESTGSILDEAVTIPQPVINRTVINYSAGNNETDNPCRDWKWTECDHSCHQSRISSSSIVTHTNGRYCLESERESRSCHIDSCGRSDPCIVPFLVHAIFILEKSHSSGEYVSAWTHQVQEDFRKLLVSAAHHPGIDKISNKRENRFFGEGDIDILVVSPWYGNETENEYLKEGNESDASIHESNVDNSEYVPLGIQLIIQISISNDNAIPKHQRAPGSGRNLLQEVGVVWSNFTSVFRGSEAASVCDPFDLYPLAKTANLVADEILGHPNFLSLLVADNTISDKDRTNGLINGMEGFSSARLVSSWTIGTQIYDDSVNYLGPVASTSLYPIIKLLHSTFYIILAIWVFRFMVFLFRSIRLCRVCGIRLRKKWFPNQVVAVEQEKEHMIINASNNHNGNSTEGGGAFSEELELAATYLGSKATKRTNSTTATLPRRVV